MNLVDSIWIVGSSIIKRSEQFAKSSPKFGTDLSLTDVTVLLKGIPELHFVICMISFLICLLQSHTHGFSLYIAKHDNPFRRQQMFMKTVINQLRSEMPLTCIVWSHILPRLYWRYAVSNVATDRSRWRINRSVASSVLKSGGASIKYPDIRVAQSNLFLNDGVHLSPLGNHVFVSTFPAAIQHFSTCCGISLLNPPKWSFVSFFIEWELLWLYEHGLNWICMFVFCDV